MEQRESGKGDVGMRWSRESRARNEAEQRESGKGDLGLRRSRESRARGI